MKKLVLPAAAVLVLALASPAGAGRYALGLAPGASPDSVSAQAQRLTGGSVSTIEPLAVIVATPGAMRPITLRRLRAVDGVSYVERLDTRRRLAFTPNDPLSKRQWHLDRIRAFSAWPTRPALPGVTVAVIDSGVDVTHPELQDRILEAKSFVEKTFAKDLHGHGTFVAGLIAAEVGNAEGIAGIAFPAQILSAKVVRSDGTVSLEAEARAIRWAADRGARVINLSLGGVRDPQNAGRDTYSKLEAAAVAYAVEKGAVVVAAVGNADEAPATPWNYASYPSALPHVIGVSALSRDGSVPSFSNRDPRYNDITAPGEEIVSTLPRGLTATRPGCEEQGYSPCGPLEFRRGEGTSFAAPQVSAAAALLLGENPLLRADQVVTLLTRSARDVNPVTGCKQCVSDRDALSGWGELDVLGSLRAAAAELPPADVLEPNESLSLSAPELSGDRREVRATLDYWNDPTDTYRVFLRKGERITVSARLRGSVRLGLTLWTPRAGEQGRRDHISAVGDSLRFRAERAGNHYVRVRLKGPVAVPYTLDLNRG